jgi:hypothetical protein
VSRKGGTFAPVGAEINKEVVESLNEAFDFLLANCTDSNYILFTAAVGQRSKPLIELIFIKGFFWYINRVCHKNISLITAFFTFFKFLK